MVHLLRVMHFAELRVSTPEVAQVKALLTANGFEHGGDREEEGLPHFVTFDAKKIGRWENINRQELREILVGAGLQVIP